MSIDFLRSVGFNSDPFASTNAADEPLIGQYFVAPPFFPAVVGDPFAPKSNIVFAPRGGGKTAQKIMIEEKSAQSTDFLCISYDRFPTESIRANAHASSEFHLTNITRILLLALLVGIESGRIDSQSLPSSDKKLVVSLSRELLGEISAESVQEGIGSVKTFGDKAYDLWSKYGKSIIAITNAIIARFEVGKIELEDGPIRKLDETSRFKFESMVSLLLKQGFSSIYILVDRVDELTMTANDAGKAFSFLRELLIDLPLLETKGVAFKFFLWDQMKEHYQDAGGRPDRLIEYSLDWSAQELEKVLSRRISTYSGGRLSSFDELLAPDTPFNVHRMLAHFAHSSPRDLIRICKKIVDEHTRSGSFSDKVPFRTVKSALVSFCAERAKELYGSQITELRKVHDLNFTISVLANDVLEFLDKQRDLRCKNGRILVRC